MSYKLCLPLWKARSKVLFGYIGVVVGIEFYPYTLRKSVAKPLVSLPTRSTALL